MSNRDLTAHAWVEVDLAAVVANARTIAATSGARLLPMVKAQAYGLGAVPVARALLNIGPWGFGVATVAEGAELRRAGITLPIVVFNPLTPTELYPTLSHHLRPTIGDPVTLAAWLESTHEPFHLAVDTGMQRAGLPWHDRAGWDRVRELLRDAPGWEGLCTHFHSADSDLEATARQWERLETVLGSLPRRPPLVHAAASSAALLGSRFAGDLVRPGIFLYGGGAGRLVPPPLPVAKLQSRVVATRVVLAGESVGYGATWIAPVDTFVATLGIGYADGLHRALSNRGTVELGDTTVPIIGRISMDMTTVRPAAPCAVGDVATVYGGLVSLDQQAEAAGTISYELLTALGARVERRYHEP
jgi:alanine racemase